MPGELFPSQMFLNRVGAKTIGLQDYFGMIINVDAMIQEKHSFQAQVTEYPVEDGTDISDHVVIKPVQLSVEGIVSNSPIYLGIDFLITNRVMTAHDTFAAAQRVAAFMSIVTGIHVYKNMIIEDYTVVREAKNGQALEFTMSLKQVSVMQTQTVEINASAPPIAQKKLDGGASGYMSDPNSMTNKVGQIQGR